MLPDISKTGQQYITQDIEAFEDSAEDLMDDLFSDVEHVLSVDMQKIRAKPKASSGAIAKKKTALKTQTSSELVVTEPKSQDILPTDSVSLTKIDLPSVPLPAISRQDILWMESHLAQRLGHSLANPSDISVNGTRLLNDPNIDLNSQSPSYAGKLADRILLGTACTSILMTALIWAYNHGALDSTWQRLSSLPPVTSPQVSPETLAFAEEVRQSLVNITKSTTSTTNSNQTIASLPSISATPAMGNGQILSLSTPGSNVQSIYIPVYQPPALPNTGSTNGNSPTVNSPNPVSGTSVAPLPTSGLPSSSQAVAPSMPNAAVAPATSYTLVGVLELGDRSSAMFDINGSVQSIRVGASVGDSGWLLSRVSQQEAVLKRGSQAKSVFVGQKF